MISKTLEKTLCKALEIAKGYHHEYATVEHLLLSLMEDDDAIYVLGMCGAKIDKLSIRLESFLRNELLTLVNESAEQVHPTSGFRRVVHKASINHLTESEVTGAEVLSELFTERESPAVLFLSEQNITQIDIVNVLSKGLVNESDNRSFAKRVDMLAEPAHYHGYYFNNKNNKLNHDINKKILHNKETHGSDHMDHNASNSALDKYCVNLNVMAASNNIDKLVGRENEINRTIEILLKRSKNNPLYVGNPGVGKTAIVEGLALRIIHGEVPKDLENIVIYSLDIGSILAGTRYRGDFEERMKLIIKEITPNIVLFIDEIHTIIGAGSTNGNALDASNLLKPYLSSGKFKCIGATTFKEYKDYFEKDAALVRRFGKIIIEEPDFDETVKILSGLKEYYEKHHGVKYPDNIIKHIVRLSHRYIHDKQLPDKAIDVLDEVGARVKLKEGASKVVKLSDVEHVVSTISKVPPQTISVTEINKLKNLKSNLHNLIYGQPEAIAELCNAIKMSRAGLRKESRPMGCYIFSGATGVGKTELAKQFAYCMNMELLRFDMSEYSEHNSAAKLIGAAPGYIGYDRGGIFSDAVSKNPFSVVLLDEIEKANHEIYNLLLQIMDYGTITDSSGRIINLTNTVIIMTTNVGAQDLVKQPIGFDPGDHSQHNAQHAVKSFFSPEFINRVDSVIAFKPLSPDIVQLVVDKFWQELQEQLADKGVVIQSNGDVKKYLASKGYDKVHGARPLDRIIQEEIKKILSHEILFGKLKKGGKVKIQVSDNALSFNYVN